MGEHSKARLGHSCTHDGLSPLDGLAALQQFEHLAVNNRNSITINKKELG